MNRLNQLCFAAVLLCVCGPAAATPVLSVDFGNRTPDTAIQSGFNSFLLNGAEGSAQVSATQTFGSYSVTVSDSNTSPADPDLDDRLRAGNANLLITDPLFDLLRDLIFADNGVVGQGIDVEVAGFSAGQQLSVTVWSFDAAPPLANQPLFVTDWFTKNTQTLATTLVANDFAFNDADHAFNFTTTADPNGKLLLQARQVSTGSSAAINGLQITVVPEPGTFAMMLFSVFGLWLLRTDRRSVR